MRFAGTWSRYSKNAMPELAIAATYQGDAAKFFRWPYHAKVMKKFDATRSRTVCSDNGTDEAMEGMDGLSGRGAFADDHLVIVDKPAGLLAVPGRGDEKQDCVSSRVRNVYAD